MRVMELAQTPQLTVAVDLMSEPCLWRWEIRDLARDEVIADSWTHEWMAYESPDEALRAGSARLAALGD
jgi:hypothetical protein